MGGDENCFAFFGEDADEVFEFDAGAWVEARGGFVHDEDLRIMDEGAAEAEPLGHALGKLVGEAVGERDKVGELHDLLDSGAAFCSAVAESPGVEVQILEHGHVLVVSKVVGHPADQGADFVGVVNDVDSADLRAAHGGIVEGGEDAHGGGLASAIRSDKSADGTVGHVEGHSVDGLEGAEIAEEVADRNGVVTHAFRGRRQGR